MKRVAIAVLLFGLLVAAGCGDDEAGADRHDGPANGGSKVGQADLDRLLNAVLPFAQDQLAKHGAFMPFGAVIGRDGDVRLVAVGPMDPALTAEAMVDDLVPLDVMLSG